MNAYRFGVEWARVQPREGRWDKEALRHYHKYIAELKGLEIEPILTIWHWTMPVWFTDKGGFAKKQNRVYFNDFVRRIAEEFASEVKYIIILNEPNTYAFFGYLYGSWPPQRKNPIVWFRVYLNLIAAHKEVYEILKSKNRALNIGVAMNLSQSRLISANPLNKILVRLKDYIWNWCFLNKTRKNLDFIGVNFYMVEYLNWRLKLLNPKGPVSDLGWYMEPEGLYDLLMSVNDRYHLPLLITENGLADAEDKQRKWWLEKTVDAMGKALKADVPLIGYLHWSLLDNFEWAFGWWPKFGLIEVDRTTMKRSVRPSAKWFALKIKELKVR